MKKKYKIKLDFENKSIYDFVEYHRRLGNDLTKAFQDLIIKNDSKKDKD